MRARLFVALWPPEVVVADVDEALAPVRRSCAELRWQTPERWHITLAFLGDCDVDRALKDSARVSAVRAAPLRLAGSGRFGPVLWLGVDESGWVGRLAAEVQRTTHAERRPFRGHVTIARSRTRGGDTELRAAVAELADFGSGAWTPGDVTLVRSTIGPRPTYEVIAHSPLTSVSG